MKMKPIALFSALLCVGCGGANQNQQPATGEVVQDNSRSQSPAADPAQDPHLSGIQFTSGHVLGVDFSKYKTYAWAAILGEINDPEGRWTKPDLNIAKEIMFLIDRELRKRGWTEVTENPDALLAYGVLVDMETLRVKIDPNGWDDAWARM